MAYREYLGDECTRLGKQKYPDGAFVGPDITNINGARRNPSRLDTHHLSRPPSFKGGAPIDWRCSLDELSDP